MAKNSVATTNNQENVSAGKGVDGGYIFVAPTGTALPTDIKAKLDPAFKVLGFISEDGYVETVDEDTSDIVDMNGDLMDSTNSNRVESAQLLSGLQSGEIDMVQQTMGDILLEDYDSMRALSNVTVVMGAPITNQSIFFNTERVTDVRIRQALLYGIDRQTILTGLVHDSGEIVDGFLCSSSPYYDASIVPTAYDPQKAAALISEAKADGANTNLEWYVNSGDATFVQAANFIAATMEELGLSIQVKTVDLSSLMVVASEGTFDVISVQYTFSPVDPYTDVSWLLSKNAWTRYQNDEVDAALMKTQTLAADDVDGIRESYAVVDRKMQEDVAMMSAYIISAMGAVNNRMQNVNLDVFGTFINVNEWDVAE